MTSVFEWIIGLFVFLFLALLPVAAVSKSSCPLIFGGGETCGASQNFAVDVSVLNPKTNQMAQGLNLEDGAYPINSLITFRIIIKNQGKNNLSNITVVNTLPKSVTFSTGHGSYDAASHTLTVLQNTLSPSESKTVVVQGIVSPSQDVFQQNPTACFAYRVIASQERETSQDTTTFCVENKPAQTRLPVAQQGKTVFPAVYAPRTPSTGPLPLALLLLPLAGGIILRKIA